MNDMCIIVKRTYSGCNFEYTGDLIRDIHGWMTGALLEGSGGKLNLPHKTYDQSSWIKSTLCQWFI